MIVQIFFLQALLFPDYRRKHLGLYSCDCSINQMIKVLFFVSDKLSVKRMKTDFALLPLTQTVHHDNYMGPSSVRHTLDDWRATLLTLTYQPWYVLWCNPKLDYKAATARLLMWTLPAVLRRVNLCRQCSSRDGDSGRCNGDNYVEVIKTLPDQKLFRADLKTFGP